jgi:hypothetical protein
VAGTYTWSAHYSGNDNNLSVNDQGGTQEQTVVSPASPSLVTTASGAVTLGTSGATLSDSAVLSGGFFETGTITFTLTGPGGFSFTQTDTVNGKGTYTASDTLTAGATAGTYIWSAHYSGDGNNLTANDQAGTAEQTVVNRPNVSLVTTASSAVTLGTTAPTLSDSAVLSGGLNPTGTITFTLTGPGGFSYTQTDTVSGNGTYTASDALPTTGTVVGTYTWSAQYSGDSGNTTAIDQGGTAEQTVVNKAHPAIVTTASPGSVTLGSSGATLSDSAVISGGFFETGTVTFTLTGPGGFSYTQTDTVSGNGTYTASDMLSAGAAAGTYTWSATYNGDGNNLTAHDQGGTAEQTVITVPANLSTATIGFWHNQGQNLLKTYGSALGNWLASTYPNLWGNLSGATGTQVANYFQLLFNNKGNLNNQTAIQALAVSFDVWVTTTGLGWNTNSNGPGSYGFKNLNDGSALFNIGSNGASFGVPNNTSLTVSQILSYFNSHASVVKSGSYTKLRTWTFYGGDNTLLTGADTVFDSINMTGDI